MLSLDVFSVSCLHKTEAKTRSNRGKSPELTRSWSASFPLALKAGVNHWCNNPSWLWSVDRSIVRTAFLQDLYWLADLGNWGSLRWCKSCPLKHLLSTSCGSIWDLIGIIYPKQITFTRILLMQPDHRSGITIGVEPQVGGGVASTTPGCIAVQFPGDADSHDPCP